MGLFGFGKSPSKPAGAKFIFADGSVLSPEEYGYLAVRVGAQGAVAQINALFGEGAMGGSLGLAQAIRKVRFAADVFTNMLHVGIYLWFAGSMLKVDSVVMDRISTGVRNCLGDMRAPNGSALAFDFKESLLRRAYSFAIAIDKDVDVSSSWPADAIRPQPLPSTALLLEILFLSNSSDAEVIDLWRVELLSPAGIWLVRMIESLTFESMEMLRKELQIRFEY